MFQPNDTTKLIEKLSPFRDRARRRERGPRPAGRQVAGLAWREAAAVGLPDRRNPGRVRGDLEAGCPGNRVGDDYHYHPERSWRCSLHQREPIFRQSPRGSASKQESGSNCRLHPTKVF